MENARKERILMRTLNRDFQECSRNTEEYRGPGLYKDCRPLENVLFLWYKVSTKVSISAKKNL